VVQHHAGTRANRIPPVPDFEHETATDFHHDSVKAVPKVAHDAATTVPIEHHHVSPLKHDLTHHSHADVKVHHAHDHKEHEKEKKKVSKHDKKVIKHAQKKVSKHDKNQKVSKHDKNQKHQKVQKHQHSQLVHHHASTTTHGTTHGKSTHHPSQKKSSTHHQTHLGKTLHNKKQKHQMTQHQIHRQQRHSRRLRKMQAFNKKHASHSSHPQHLMKMQKLKKLHQSKLHKVLGKHLEKDQQHKHSAHEKGNEKGQHQEKVHHVRALHGHGKFVHHRPGKLELQGAEVLRLMLKGQKCDCCSAPVVGGPGESQIRFFKFCGFLFLRFVSLDGAKLVLA
jgi:hypothetical protein